MHLFFFFQFFPTFVRKKKPQTKNSSIFKNFTDCEYTPCSVDCLCTEFLIFTAVLEFDTRYRLLYDRVFDNEMYHQWY